MAVLTSTISSNYTTGTAVLTYFLDDVPISSYSWTGATVLIGALVDVTVVTLAQVEQAQIDRRVFYNWCRTAFAPPSVALGPFYKLFKRTNTKVVAKFDTGQAAFITDLELVTATNVVTFQPRLEYTVTWAQFTAWTVFWDELFRVVRGQDTVL